VGVDSEQEGGGADGTSPVQKKRECKRSITEGKKAGRCGKIRTERPKEKKRRGEKCVVVRLSGGKANFPSDWGAVNMSYAAVTDRVQGCTGRHKKNVCAVGAEKAPASEWVPSFPREAGRRWCQIKIQRIRKTPHEGERKGSSPSNVKP